MSVDVWFRHVPGDMITEARDTGARGKRFERALMKGFELLGMAYETNTEVGGPLWDVRAKGTGWTRIVKNRNANIKISGTKWAFSDAALALMLPWAEGSMDPESGPEELSALAKRVKAHLDARGLASILWLRPKDSTVEAAIEDAVAAKDTDRLDKLLRGANFKSTDFTGYGVRVTRHRKDPSRVGSIAITLGGRTIARSEAPRIFSSGSPRVGFRREGRPTAGRPHGLRPKRARRPAPGLAQQLIAERVRENRLIENRQGAPHNGERVPP